VYLGTDILGSVRSATGEAGTLEGRYEYDAFGRPYKGNLENGMNLGYTRKPYDSRTGLYNYGYRDYEPGTARFTTVDPVRDGSNWFAYVNNDPVNWVDPWGLSASDNDKSTTPNLDLTDPENKTPKTPGQIAEDKINEQLEKFGEKTGHEFSDNIGGAIGYAVDLFAGGQPLSNTGINVHLKGDDFFNAVTKGEINGTVTIELKIGRDAGLSIKLPFVDIDIPFK
jgi:RHS repeat-associated protein